MKKLFAILIIFIMALSACGNIPEENPAEIPEESHSESAMDDGNLVDCIFKENGKYGIRFDGRIIAKAEYDEYKEIGRIGGMTLYALGKESGTKPAILYDEDEHPYGVGEAAKTLYDIYSDEGKLIISYPVDDMERYDKETLFASVDGSFYEYTFSDEGEIVSEEATPAGKTGEKYNGLEKTCYYYGASPLSAGYGLVNADGAEVVPAVYTSFRAVFDDRIIAEKRDGFGFWNTCLILDNEGNIICDKYHSVSYYHMGEDEYVGIGEVANPQSQVISICRDENGEIMPSGKRFIDKDGKELSDIFTEDIVSADGMITAKTDGYIFTAKMPQDPALEEWIKNLKPQQVFETEKEYPAVIGEIFEIIMEANTEEYKSKELKRINAFYGDENEFYVSFNYVAEADPDCYLAIRVEKTEDGKYALLARGGGPLAYGLEEAKMTLEDIQ